MNTLCLVLSHNYVITINQYLNQCLHLVLFACILSDEKARKTFYKKVALCSDGGEWRDNFHFSSNKNKKTRVHNRRHKLRLSSYLNTERRYCTRVIR